MSDPLSTIIAVLLVCIDCHGFSILSSWHNSR